MKHILLITIFLITRLCVLSQDIIDDYKSAADKEIFKSFDSSLIGLIRCKEVRYIAKFDVETWSPNYDKVKFEKVKPQSISFTYSFFSKPILDSFSFVVSVTKKPNKPLVISGVKSIPACIKQNAGCLFITRDSAIKIALKDSILYPENIFSTFWKHYNRNDYYWIITGRPVEVHSNLHRRRVTKFLTHSRKYINALTGQLISWQDYQKLK